MPDIILKDKDGADITYTGVQQVKLKSATPGEGFVAFSSDEVATKEYVDTAKSNLRNEILSGSNNYSGNNDFYGDTTFEGAITVPAPTAHDDATNKKYVDDLYATVPKLSQSNKFTGRNEFKTVVFSDIDENGMLELDGNSSTVDYAGDHNHFEVFHDSERFIGSDEDVLTSNNQGKVLWKNLDQMKAMSGLRIELNETKRSLDHLWKLNKGQTFDIEQVECEGIAQLPVDGEYGNIDEVRGKTEQVSTNGYQLFDSSSLTPGKDGVNINVNGTEIEISSTDLTFANAKSSSISVNPGDTYTLSAKSVDRTESNNGTIQVRLLDDSGSVLNRIAPSDKELQKTFSITNESTTHLDIVLYSNNSSTATGTYTLKIDGFMLEKGSIAHDFEPYTGSSPSPSVEYPQEIKSIESFTVQLLNEDESITNQRVITPPSPLNKINNYIDKCDIVNGTWYYVNKEVSPTIFYIRETSSNWPFPRYAFTAPKFALDTRTNGAFSHGIYEYGVNRTSASVRKDGDLVGYIFANIGETIEEANSWLADNPVKIIYTMAEPESVQIDENDLEWLRNLTLTAGATLKVTDNHGRDVSYLMSDIIALKRTVI